MFVKLDDGRILLVSGSRTSYYEADDILYSLRYPKTAVLESLGMAAPVSETAAEFTSSGLTLWMGSVVAQAFHEWLTDPESPKVFNPKDHRPDDERR